MEQVKMINPRDYVISKVGVLFLWLNTLSANHVSMTDADVRQKFEKAGLFEDLIPIAPKHALEVSFAKKTVNFGNNFTREDLKDPPKIVRWPSQEDRLYTLIFTDPDVPKRSSPIDKEWQHWIVVNIPGCNIDKGEVLSAYIGALPYHLQFPHRYVFLVYLQPDKTPVTFDEPRLGDKPVEQKRYRFSTNEFAEKYNLGVPIAGNFLMAGSPEPPQEVPEILKHLLTTKSPG